MCHFPDQWKTETEIVLVKKASTKKIAVPAKFETRTERVLVKEASTRLTVIPTKYEKRTERVLVEAATTKWVKQKDAMCRSQNSDDCIVWCLVEVPARYKTVTKRVLVSPASTTEREIPAQYKTVTKRVLVSPATSKTVDIPAEYKTVTNRVLVKKGGFSEYKEVVCSKYVTNDLVRQVQRALMAKGYSVGPARDDNILGKDTRAALIKYQTDNGLPVGNLNKETMKHLGVPAKYWDK